MSLSRVLRRNGFHGENNTDFSAIVANLYGMTVPRLTNTTVLAMWEWCAGVRRRLRRASTVEAGVAYLREKSFYTLHALYHAHLLNRVVESCSIQGIDVTDELVRGSQYKIENLLLRINNSSEFNFICLNATERQVSVNERCE